jgi:hypothetical protein
MAKQTITGTFNTRRKRDGGGAPRAGLRLDRSLVQVGPAGEENTSGTVASGADAAERHRGTGAPGDRSAT